MSLPRPALTKLKESIQEEYARRTRNSASLHERAKKVMPGGDTRTSTHFEPYPLFMDRGDGCFLTDVDGNSYLDFLNNYTALVHGHSHPAIIGAVAQQLKKGTSFATPLEAQIRLAKVLTERFCSIELIRFCNSGTEATMFAVRAAKAFTGKDKILKIEGGYHGSHDVAQLTFDETLDGRDPDGKAWSGRDNSGLFHGIAKDVLFAPFNDLEATGQILQRCQDNLAAVIVEPVLGAAGIIPATSQYLRLLRQATRDCRALLIFDEIITLRLSYGGAQEMFGIAPDLTTLGKIIGGGFPIGAFGGRGDVMTLFEPIGGTLSQSGTFNGNAISVIAGATAMDLLSRQEIARINSLGDQLRDGFRDALNISGFRSKVTGVGSLLGLHFTTEEVTDYRASARASKTLLALIHLCMLNSGIFAAPRGLFCTSTPMAEKDTAAAVRAFRECLQRLETLQVSES